MVGTPECQAKAEETEAAEAVEDFQVEVTDYIVRLCRLCIAMLCFVLSLAYSCTIYV